MTVSTFSEIHLCQRKGSNLDWLPILVPRLFSLPRPPGLGTRMLAALIDEAST